MKKLKIPPGLMVFILLALFSQNTIAKEKTEKTLVSQKFAVDQNASLIIRHKFGNIQCRNWNERSVSVTVKAYGYVSDKQAEDKLFDKIHIKLKGDKTRVSIETDFSEKLFNNNNNEISVDIEIMMPEDVSLDLDHKFGNAFIETVSNQTNISSEYGSLEINALKDEANKIEINFGEAQFHYINMADIEISYSEISVDESEQLHIKSEYSDISIEKSQEIKMENEGGKIVIGDASWIRLSSTFSTIVIDNIEKMLNTKTEYGSLKVRNIDADFSSVVIDNSFGTTKLTFDAMAAFYIEANMDFCNLEYPKKRIVFTELVSDVTSQTYKGTVGGNSSTATVKINSSYGNVSIDY